MAEINAEFGANLQSFADLHGFSVRETEAFWSKAWDFLGVIGDKGAGPVLKLGERFEEAKFFEGARLNYAENLLRKNDDNNALIFWGEDKVKKTLTWAELHAAVSRAQQFLRAQGVREGDRVAALMPNKPEAVVGLLAASSLGAIWSCASPDFGVQGVLDRFGQIEPKVFIACDGYYYRSKALPIGDKVAEIIEKLAERRDCADRAPISATSSRFCSAPSRRSPGERRSAPSRQSPSSSTGFPSPIPPLFSIPRARRARRNASFIRRAAR